MKLRKRRNPTNVLKGKVAHLPLVLRDELNRRLLDGQTGNEVLEWINAEPAAIARMRALHGGKKISHQNLSEWRKRGFANFLRQRQPTEISRG